MAFDLDTLGPFEVRHQIQQTLWELGCDWVYAADVPDLTFPSRVEMHGRFTPFTSSIHRPV